MAENNKTAYSFSKHLFISAFINNPVLIQAVGLGAVVAVATTLKTSLLLALVFAPVMIITQVIASLILKKVPRWIRITLYLLIGTALIVPVIYFIDIYLPEIRLGAGIYLALTALNSITAIHCEKIAVKVPVKTAFLEAAATSIGYAAVILLVGFFRELIGASSIWGIHVNLPISYAGALMPFGGFLAIAFLAAGLKAIVNWKFPKYFEDTEVKIKKTAVIVSKKKLEEVEGKTQDKSIEKKETPKADKQESKKQKNASEKAPEKKTAEKTDNKAQTKTQAKAEDKTDAKAETKEEIKTEAKTEAKTEEKTETKAASPAEKNDTIIEAGGIEFITPLSFLNTKVQSFDKVVDEKRERRSNLEKILEERIGDLNSLTPLESESKKETRRNNKKENAKKDGEPKKDSRKENRKDSKNGKEGKR